MVVQAGGVGMMRLGAAGTVFSGDAGEGEQAVRRRSKMNGKEKRLRILMSDCIWHPAEWDILIKWIGAVYESLLTWQGRAASYWIASLSWSKDVIQAMVLMKSTSESLCSRRARTAGPTGSSPAAPPGASA